MALGFLRNSTCFIVLLLAFPIDASDSKCIVVSFLNADAAREDAIFRQLRTELKMPIHKGERPGSCWRLVVEFQGKTSHISLTRQQTFNTVIHLDDFLPALWPRAIALSASGLWILARDQAREAPIEKAGKEEESTPEEDTGNTPQEEKKSKPRETHHTLEQTEISADMSSQKRRSDYRIRVHMLAGVRLVVKSRVGVFELSSGVSASISTLHFDLSLLGLWGRKSLDSGQIYTTGGGLRATMFWQPVKRQSISFGTGPAIEVIGVYGYGRGREGMESKHGFYPVVNLLLLVGGWVELSPRTIARAAIGGGFSAVYFNMQKDGETVSGISGGSANLTFGFSFGRPLRSSDGGNAGP
jgi:hypothetical protein